MSLLLVDGDEAAEQRYRALQAAGVGPQALEGLLRGLYDESWRVRKLAAELVARVEPTQELFARLIATLGDRGQTGARNAAATALALLGPPAVAPLVGLLEHADPDQRKFAADILGQLRSEEAVPALTRALDDGDENVQAGAAEALGMIGGPHSGRVLEKLLDSPSPLLRVCALEGLSLQSRPPPLPRLVALLSDGVTQRSAYRLLGQLSHPAAFSLLCRGFHTAARDAALAGLGSRSVGPDAEAEAMLRAALRRVGDLQPWLERALASEDLELRRGALYAVGACSLERLAPAVAEAAEGGELFEPANRVLTRLGLAGARALLEGDPPALVTLSRESRTVAADAVLRAADPSLVPPLVSLLTAGDFELAELSARALGRTRAAEAVAPLGTLLDDDLLASAAARALVVLGGSWPLAVAEALLTALKARPRPHAVRAYAQVAAPAAALELLRRASQDPDDSVRAAAAESAAHFGTTGVELLGTALMDESPLVRRSVARALPQLTSPEATPLLERALADEDPNVRTAAATAVGESGAAALAPTLEKLLEREDGAVALAALQALFQLGLLGAASLGRALEHEDAEVLKAAITFAAEQPLGAQLAQAQLGHPRWDVRVAAARTLSVCGGREALVPLHAALERETDALARELMMAAAATLAGR